MFPEVLNLPDNNPFTSVIRWMFILMWAQFIVTTVLTLALIRHMRRNVSYDKELALAELWAALGKERRDDAKAVVSSELAKQTNELKEVIGVVPDVVTAKVAKVVVEHAKTTNGGSHDSGTLPVVP